MLEQEERDVVRGLLEERKKIADSAQNMEKIEGWKKINGLQDHRPMLWITELPWREFEDGVDELKCVCETDQYRRREANLRRTLFTLKHLPCDEVAAGTAYVGRRVTGHAPMPRVKEEQIAQGQASISAHHYEPVIKDMDDIEQIGMPNLEYDHEATMASLASEEELCKDIMPVEICGPRMFFFNAWDRVVRWTGVTEALMDLVMRPDYIHALMRRLTDSQIATMKQSEALGILGHPYPMVRVGSGADGHTDELPQPDADPDRIRLIDQWGGATPQIFSEVSPDMHREFALKYEIEVMELCGLNYYGCCEPLHDKMEILAKVPRLRKISVSPWCDVAKTAREAKQKYVFSHKPSPAMLADDVFNAERAEKDIRDRIEQSGENPCEFIMKDISTVRNDIDRVIEWCSIAYRVINE